MCVCLCVRVYVRARVCFRARVFFWCAVEVMDEEDGGALKKRKFRSRAHANPLADPQFEYPVSPMSVPISLSNCLAPLCISVCLHVAFLFYFFYRSCFYRVQSCLSGLMDVIYI